MAGMLAGLLLGGLCLPGPVRADAADEAMLRAERVEARYADLPALAIEAGHLVRAIYGKDDGPRLAACMRAAFVPGRAVQRARDAMAAAGRAGAAPAPTGAVDHLLAAYGHLQEAASVRPAVDPARLGRLAAAMAGPALAADDALTLLRLQQALERAITEDLSRLDGMDAAAITQVAAAFVRDKKSQLYS